MKRILCVIIPLIGSIAYAEETLVLSGSAPKFTLQHTTGNGEMWLNFTGTNGSPTTGLSIFHIDREQGEWSWESGSGAGLHEQMSLENNGALTVYGTNGRKIEINPVSSSFGSVVITGTSGTRTLLSVEEGDVRYIRPAQNQAIAFGTGTATNNSWSSGPSDATGGYSRALGYWVFATGFCSTIMGHSGYASGDYSTAMGKYVTSSGNSAVAMGQSSTASGNYSTAMGYLVTARGSGGVALGYNSSTGASSNYAFSAGLSNQANGYASVAIGANNISAGVSSLALGYQNTASGQGSVALGLYTNASASGAVSLGGYNSAQNWGGVAIGLNNTTGPAAQAALALGQYNSSTGSYASTIGYFNVASMESAKAIGVWSEAKAKYANVMGGYQAKSYIPGQVVVGAFNDPGYTLVGGVGKANYELTDAVFVVGNGYRSLNATPNTRLGLGAEGGYDPEDYSTHTSNAFVVKWNGNAEVQGGIKTGTGKVSHFNGPVRLVAQGDVSMGDFQADPNAP